MSNVRRPVNNPSVSQAFEQFEEAAKSVGLPIMSEVLPASFGSRMLYVGNGAGRLRLACDGREEYLSLETSHGPSDGPQVGWLVLFDAQCHQGHLPEESGDGA